MAIEFLKEVHINTGTSDNPLQVKSSDQNVRISLLDSYDTDGFHVHKGNAYGWIGWDTNKSVKISNQGRVGIGHSPANGHPYLTVKGTVTGSVTPAVRLWNTSSTTGGILEARSGSGSAKFWVGVNGKTAVGTNAPKQLFHVSGGATSGDVSKVVIGATGGNAESHLYLAESFSGDDVNYGFSFVTDGNSTNNLLIKRHNNSTSGTTVITVERDVSNVEINGSLRVIGAIKDSSGDIGSSGQILSSTGVGTNWIDADSGSSGISQSDADTRYVNVTGDTMTGDLQISKADPTLILQDTTANTDPSGRIIFRETATSNNFELNYNGANDRLEFRGRIGSTDSVDLMYINRDTTTPVNILGSATLTGVIKTADGSAATPAYNFTSHAGNGMYLEEYDADNNKEQISISTDGYRRLKVNEAGVWSDQNFYVSGQWRTFSSWWDATNGTSGGGFRFRNTANGTTPLSITSSGVATFLSDVLTDKIKGVTYSNNSFLDFDDDTGVGGQGNTTTLSSVGPMHFIIDSNNNGSTDKFHFLKGNTSPNSATSLASIDLSGNATFEGDVTANGTVIGDGNLFLRSYNNAPKGIFFRDGFEYGDTNQYNLSITIYDDGDGAADGMNINAYDGIYFNVQSGATPSTKFRVLNSEVRAYTNLYTSGDLTVSGGDITLGGTGRIQGVDTVTAGTDAANKNYVDGLNLNVTGSSNNAQIYLRDANNNNLDNFTIGGLAGAITVNAGTNSLTIGHHDTSSAASSDNSGGTVIQDITLDTYGHVTAIGTTNLDSRYFTETEADGRYLRSNAADTATGQIFFDAGFDAHPIMLSGSQNFDNIDRSGFYNLYNTHTGSTNSPGFPYGTMIAIGNDKGSQGFGLQIAHERTGTGMYVRGMNDTASAWSAWAEIWTSTTDGSGSGLDADKVDGLQGSQFLRSDANDTATGSLRFQNDLNYFGLATTNNEAEIVVNTGVAGSPQIGFTEHGDASWAIGIDDADNSFKIHGAANSTIPTINGLGTPIFELTTGGLGYFGTQRIFADNYHPNADKWTAARTITLSGDLNGSVSIDGSSNVTLSAQVVNNSHQHSKLYEESTITYGSGHLQWTDQSGNGGAGTNGNTAANPFNDWHHHIIMNHANSGGYYVDMAYSFHNDRVHFRRLENGSFGSWREFFHTGHLPTWGEISGKPSTFTPSSHTHDDRYYTESEIDSQNTTLNETLAHLRGWVPAYSNASDASVRWNRTEDALELQSGDTSTGVAYQARRIEAGETVRFTIMVKGSAASSSGLYLRLYQHDGDMPDGKTHVSNSASGTYVQEDDRGDSGWYENSAITTSWVTFEREYTAPVDGYVSLVVLNWTGIGTNSVYLKTPDIQTIRSANADKLDGQQGSYYLNYNNFTNTPTIPSTSSFVTTNTTQTISGAKTFSTRADFTANESIRLKGARGQFTGEYIHLYNKVGIGHPSGWGQGNSDTPNYGLSTYGAANFAYGNNATSTFYGDVIIDKGTSTTLWVKCDDGGNAIVRATGEGQGTGAFEVGQSNTYGGGISYNGDNSPAFVNGESSDHITFYRLSNNARTEVFSYPHNSNDVNFNGDITVAGGQIYITDTNTKLERGVGNAFRITTNSGYGEFGPMNTGHCHVQTDRSNFYFNKELQVDTGRVGSYNEDLQLHRAGTTKIQVKSDHVEFVDPVEGPSFGSTNSNVSRVMLPHGASYSGSGTVTGAFKIKLPVSWTNTMMSMRVVIYDYSDGESFEVQCGGYNHTGSGGYWVNMFGHIIADPNKDRAFNIRFGHDGSNCCIFIGETSSTWSYPKVVVTEFIGGHSGYTHANWDNNWDITAVTSFPSNIDHTESLNQIGRNVEKLIDVNNSGRYLDLDGTSVLSAIHCKGSATNTAPRWDTSFHVVQSQHWYGHSSTQTMYLGESGNKTRVRGSMRVGTDADAQSGYKLSVNGSLHMNNSEVNYVSQLHFNDNVRFYDAGNDQYLNFKWGDTGAGGIKFYDGNTLLHGYVYGDGAGGFGLLDKDGQWFVRTDGATLTEFRVNNSVAMKLTTSYVESHKDIFITSDTGSLWIGGSNDNDSPRVRIHCASGTGYLDWQGGTTFNFRSDTTTRAQLTDAGVWRAANDIVAYYSFSDERLKTDIKPLANNLDKVLKLEPVEYRWKDGGRDGKKEIGLVAQQVEKIVPEVVREQERINDDTKYKQVDYEHLVSVLIGAVQELKEEIEELKQNGCKCQCKN